MYAAYHTNGRNQLTHYIGVPMIVFSILVGLALVRIEPIPLSGAPVVLGLLLLAYFIAIPAIGLVSSLACVPLCLLAEKIAELEAHIVWIIVALCFIGGWIIQFVGHIFERRRPVFLTNVLQIFMAPAFLMAETLFAAGLQRDLAEALRTRAQKYTRS